MIIASLSLFSSGIDHSCIAALLLLILLLLLLLFPLAAVIQVLQVQMNDYKYHYHMTTFDIEIHDLENMKYNFVNLTAFRIVDSSNPIVRHVLRDIERFSPKGKSILNKTNVIQVSRQFDVQFRPDAAVAAFTNDSSDNLRVSV